MQSKTISRTRKLVECAILIAIASVLSIIKIIEMPYGGSVTIASMLPIIIIAYKYGAGWGLSSGLIFAVIQQLMGLKKLSYGTSWPAVVAIILLDYIIAFTVAGLGGVFRKDVYKRQVLLCARTRVGRLRFAIMFAIVKVLPLPVTPRRV